MARPVVVALVAFVVLPSGVEAQQSPVYVGASLSLVTQTRSEAEPMGGTVRGGGVVFGVQVSPRIAVEFEPWFGGSYTSTYSYRPGPSSIADVVASRRDSFISCQLRTRVGVLEPVVGLSYLHAKVGRHATIRGGTTYFDESRTDHGLALVGGLDAAFRISQHVSFVPTFRLLAAGRLTSGYTPGDPLGADTSTGPVAFRYGAGVRVVF